MTTNNETTTVAAPTTIDASAVKAAFASLEKSDAAIAKAEQSLQAAIAKRQESLAALGAALPENSRKFTRNNKRYTLVFGKAGRAVREQWTLRVQSDNTDVLSLDDK